MADTNRYEVWVEWSETRHHRVTKSYPAKSLAMANSIVDWALNVEYETLRPVAQIIPINEERYTQLGGK